MHKEVYIRRALALGLAPDLRELRSLEVNSDLKKKYYFH